jgi:PAS domain S-box-containing protein
MKRPGEANIVLRAVMAAATYVLATGGLLAVLLFQLRAEALVSAKRELGAFAQLTAGHTSEVVLGVEDALQLATMTLAIATDGRTADRDSIRAMLADVAKNARVLKDIVVLNADGQVVYQANGSDDIDRNRADQAYFTRLKNDRGLTFDVTPLTRDASAAAGSLSIPMAYAWRRGKELAGIVVGFMDPQYFDKAWTFDAEIEGLAISLASADGTLIVHRPFADGAAGRFLLDPQAQKLLRGDLAADTLRTSSPIDGRERLVAYRRVATYPDLLVFVSQPLDVVFADWRRIALIIGSCWLVASLALGALGAWLIREIRAHGILESRYRVLFDSIPHPVIVSDTDASRVLAFNDAAARQYGWTAGGKTTRTAPAQPLSLPPDFALLRERYAQFSAEAATAIEGQRHRNGDRDLIDVDLTVRLIDYDNRPAILTIAVDVTARMEAERAQQAAEDQLRQAQKMEVLGQLTGGIAHDFNNILMVIEGNVESLLEKHDIDADGQRQLLQISASAQRAEELTRQMLAFSRKQPLRPRPTSVNDLVVDTGKLLRRSLGEQIEIDAVLADDLWRVDIDRAQLETTLVNLCLNARDAIPGGGHVLIETRNVTLDAPPAGIADSIAGDCVLIAVSDTGRGMPSEILPKIFEPFFTTKTAGKGSGLGLSMVYGFIRQSKGHIEVTSTVGQGTTVKIYLPRSSAAAAGTPGHLPSAAVVGGRERVLVVEDDEQVRGSVARQLRDLGYAVEEAADGITGLAAFEAARPAYDLLLSDVIMPGSLNGKELADEVARRWPRTRIVFMSGYTDNAFGEQRVLLLSKPFRKSDLAQMMRLALDGEMASTAAS